MLKPKNNDGVSLWQDKAKCIESDSAIFFSPDDTKVAKKLCVDCPVISECLEYALLYNMSGVWGGTTDKERRKISRFNVRLLRDDYIESGLYNQQLKI